MNQPPPSRHALGRALLVGALASLVLVVVITCAWAFLVPTHDHRNLRYQLWTLGHHAFAPAFAEAFARDPGRDRLVVGAQVSALARLFPHVGQALDPQALDLFGLTPQAGIEYRWLGNGWLIETSGGLVVSLLRPAPIHC
ncbi:MAG: hypothetical protein H0W72_07520 [Planctomycetes bacterium]|nr:hypothetical protein [Planctomycetota bacterium]